MLTPNKLQNKPVRYSMFGVSVTGMKYSEDKVNKQTRKHTKNEHNNLYIVWLNKLHVYDASGYQMYKYTVYKYRWSYSVVEKKYKNKELIKMFIQFRLFKMLLLPFHLLFPQNWMFMSGYVILHIYQHIENMNIWILWNRLNRWPKLDTDAYYNTWLF